MATKSLFEQEALPQVDALQNFALQLCRDEQYSRDLVQETLLKAYTYFDTYREGTNCRAWLFQICKNSYINDAKRKRLQPVAIDLQEQEAGENGDRAEDEGRGLHIAFHERFSESVQTDVLSDEVTTAFETLPADYQTVLILCDVEGYTYGEIAEYMQAPVGTIRSRIHRGRKMLASQLLGYARAQGYLSHQSSTNN